MSDFMIRVAHPHEFDTVGRLTVAAYQDDGHLDTDSDYAAELADAAARAARATVLVAVDEDTAVLGSVTFCRAGSPYAEIARPGEAEFRMLAVAGGTRRRGVGQALVLACADRARRHGDIALVLSSQRRMHAAHRLYERLGFERTPELDHEPVPGIELITYRLAL